MIIAEKRLRRIIKEELDEYMIDNLARLYFGPDPEPRAQAKEVLSSLNQEEQALFLLIDKIWEGYPAEQIKEMASSYGILEEFLQLYKDSIFHMLYGWDSGRDAIYVSYIHPVTEKEIELDIPIDDMEDEESILYSVNYIVDEIINHFPLTRVLKSSNAFKVKMDNKTLEALRNLNLI